MFIIVDLQTVIHAQFVGMFAVYLLAGFRVPRLNGSLVTSVRLKAKANVRCVVLRSVKYGLLHAQVGKNTFCCHNINWVG
jgi:hypothetical protein